MRPRMIAGVLFAVIVHAAGVRADIFEYGRAADTALREQLKDDRSAYYWQTPGLDHQPSEEVVSGIRGLASEPLIRLAGLRDMDKSFDLFLAEQLRKDRNYKNMVAFNHPLLLLEYASPVLADVVKHYRMSVYERLAIEQARLAAIDSATEDRTDRLARAAERACLERNAHRGLVDAMRACQKERALLHGLPRVDPVRALDDGRHRLHVVAEALARLGFDKRRISGIVAMTGDVVVGQNLVETKLPAMTFERKAVARRQELIRQWHDALARFRRSGGTTPGKFEALSFPGMPVNNRILADLDLLDAHAQQLGIFKLASAGALLDTQRSCREAVGYLDICLTDPILSSEFRAIIREKREGLMSLCAQAGEERAQGEIYKQVIASIAGAADDVRARNWNRTMKISGFPTDRDMLLNFREPH